MRFLAFFALVALVEVATFFWVGSQIGLGWAFGLAVTTAVLGAFLVRRAGLSIFNRIRTKMNQGQVPGRELTDGAAVLVAGAFLISPGFITDILGFLLLIPAVRSPLHSLVAKRMTGRVRVFTSGATRSTPGQLGDVIDVDPLD